MGSLFLELQAGAAGGFGEGLDSAVIRESTAIEDHRFDAGLAGSLGNRLADGGRAFDTGRRLHRLAQVGVRRRGGDQRAAGSVVDDLRIAMMQAAEHGQPGAGRPARQVVPKPGVPADARAATISLLVHPYFAPPAVLPVLPALRRIRSSRYMMPLPL